MFCPQCGSEQRDDASYCTQCSTYLGELPPGSNHEKKWVPIAIAVAVVIAVIAVLAAAWFFLSPDRNGEPLGDSASSSSASAQSAVSASSSSQSAVSSPSSIPASGSQQSSAATSSSAASTGAQASSETSAQSQTNQKSSESAKSGQSTDITPGQVEAAAQAESSNGNGAAPTQDEAQVANEEPAPSEMAYLEGVWVGDRSGTTSCYAGDDHPAKLTVKRVDETSGVIEADLEYLAHWHRASTNPVKETEGDTVEVLSDILIPIDRSGIPVRAYQIDPPESGYEFKKLLVMLSYKKDQTLYLTIEATYGTNDTGGSVWFTDSYTDRYTMTKQ